MFIKKKKMMRFDGYFTIQFSDYFNDLNRTILDILSNDILMFIYIIK